MSRMRVTLTTPGNGVQQQGKILEVRSGLARNYLLPHDLAREVQDESSTLKFPSPSIKLSEKEQAARTIEAHHSKTISAMRIAIKRQADEMGHLLEPISAKDVRRELVARGFNFVSEDRIVLGASPHRVGLLTAEVALRFGFSATLRLFVSASAWHRKGDDLSLAFEVETDDGTVRVNIHEALPAPSKLEQGTFPSEALELAVSMPAHIELNASASSEDALAQLLTSTRVRIDVSNLLIDTEAPLASLRLVVTRRSGQIDLLPGSFSRLRDGRIVFAVPAIFLVDGGWEGPDPATRIHDEFLALVVEAPR